MSDYRIVVKTGGADGAGTDANVYITLIGARVSDERALDSSDNDFERNSVGTYSLHTGTSLGNLKQIRIRHDNTGNKPGWFLDYITVHEENTNNMWYFPCNRWLSVSDDDHLIDRTLNCNQTQSGNLTRANPAV